MLNAIATIGGIITGTALLILFVGAMLGVPWRRT